VKGLSLQDMTAVFGEAMARHFFELARGIDPRNVVPEHERKSIGREITFDQDVASRKRVEQALLGLVEDVCHRLRGSHLSGRTITVKLRTEDFVTVSRRETVPVGIDTTEALWPVARALLHRADATQQAVRLVGVAVSHFSESAQLSLFEDARSKRERKLAGAVDAVKARFGAEAITRGALLDGREGDEGEGRALPREARGRPERQK
jgi:DNA polymerase-4